MVENELVLDVITHPLKSKNAEVPCQLKLLGHPQNLSENIEEKGNFKGEDYDARQ